MSHRRTTLIRNLAEIDQLLAEAESIAEDHLEEREQALDLLMEFQGWKRAVEVELKDA